MVCAAAGDMLFSSSLASTMLSGGVFSNVRVMIGPPAAERSSTSSFGGGSLPWKVVISYALLLPVSLAVLCCSLLAVRFAGPIRKIFIIYGFKQVTSIRVVGGELVCLCKVSPDT